MPAEILDVLDLLLHGFATAWARAQLDVGHLERGHVIHPGDPMGKTIAWLWRSGQQARLKPLVTTYILTLRNATTPRVRFADLLAGVPMAMPTDFPDTETPALVDFLREAVPRGFGENPDEA